MYIHITKLISDSNTDYPSWMSFRNSTSDGFYQYFDLMNSEITHASRYLVGKSFPAPTLMNYHDEQKYHAVYSNLSGTYYGDGNLITMCLNTNDFLSPIPTRCSYSEQISLSPLPENPMFAACFIDTISGEVMTLAPSGIYTYDLSGHITDSNVYNLLSVENELLEFDPYGRYELQHIPHSGSISVLDVYQMSSASIPNSQFILSGAMVHAVWQSGVYYANYDYLIYEHDSKFCTSTPNHDIYNADYNIYAGVELGEKYSDIDFELDATSSYVRLIADSRDVRPGRNAVVGFKYRMQTITTWSDSKIDKIIFPISGSLLLDESIRVFSTGSNGELPLYLLGNNLYVKPVTSATAVYPETVETEVTPFYTTLLSGNLTAGTIYISYYSEYTKEYSVSGQQSYYPTETLSTQPYADEYTIENGIVFPKTIFGVSEPLSHIRRMMTTSIKEDFYLKSEQGFGGICKRFGSNDLWVGSTAKTFYENKIDGRRLFLSTSPYETDEVVLYALAPTDKSWGKCYLENGTYTMTDQGAGLVRYYKYYPFANFNCDAFELIGLHSIDKYLLAVLYQNGTILLVYYDPDKAGTFDLPDVVEISRTLTNPKDSFIFDNRLFILANNKLEVFDLYHDYMIPYGERTLFRENYAGVVG